MARNRTALLVPRALRMRSVERKPSGATHDEHKSILAIMLISACDGHSAAGPLSVTRSGEEQARNAASIFALVSTLKQ